MSNLCGIFRGLGLRCWGCFIQQYVYTKYVVLVDYFGFGHPVEGLTPLMFHAVRGILCTDVEAGSKSTATL